MNTAWDSRSTADRSNPDQCLLALLALQRVGTCRGLEPLHQSPKLECQQPVFRARAPKNREKGFGADQYGLGLAMNCQHATCIGIFQVLEHFWQIAVQFTAPNVTNTRLRHQ